MQAPIVYLLVCFNFFLIFIYDREREREAETQAEGEAEGEAGSMQGARGGTRFRDTGITP